MLTLYRRHKESCKQHGTRENNKCKCKIWADGIVAGQDVRKSLDLRDWTKANQVIQRWEAEERIVERESAVTLDEAWTSIHADFVSRNLADATIRKYKQLEKQMKVFAEKQGLNLLKHFDLDHSTQFRNTWKIRPRTAAVRLANLRTFFGFAFDRQWITSNPATKIKMPKVEETPTMPLTPDEMVKIYKACDDLVEQRPKEGKLNAVRLKSLIFVMRYTGLRVSDAVALTTSQIEEESIVVRTTKTHVTVKVPVPHFLLIELAKTPKQTKTRFFWAGIGSRETVAKKYQARIKEVFDMAGIAKGESNAMSHRLRDTFAVELLQANTPIERVSKLLCHKSVAITEKHYAPWNEARQRLAEADVRRSWENDPQVTKIPGTVSVQFPN